MNPQKSVSLRIPLRLQSLPLMRKIVPCTNPSRATKGFVDEICSSRITKAFADSISHEPWPVGILSRKPALWFSQRTFLVYKRIYRIDSRLSVSRRSRTITECYQKEKMAHTTICGRAAQEEQASLLGSQPWMTPMRAILEPQWLPCRRLPIPPVEWAPTTVPTALRQVPLHTLASDLVSSGVMRKRGIPPGFPRGCHGGCHRGCHHLSRSSSSYRPLPREQDSHLRRQRISACLQGRHRSARAYPGDRPNGRLLGCSPAPPLTCSPAHLLTCTMKARVWDDSHFTGPG
jgi:hypothetical protein